MQLSLEPACSSSPTWNLAAAQHLAVRGDVHTAQHSSMCHALERGSTSCCTSRCCCTRRQRHWHALEAQLGPRSQPNTAPLPHETSNSTPHQHTTAPQGGDPSHLSHPADTQPTISATLTPPHWRLYHPSRPTPAVRTAVMVRCQCRQLLLNNTRHKARQHHSVNNCC